ncbi:MAG: RAD55 family ATPase [Candidatus Hermodarchaeia archaeon]|jgi:KaiC/GvpD/RAD55 family RecA-like ATPase
MRCSTGIPALDDILGKGLILGENVVWEYETGTFIHEFLQNFMRQGVVEKNQVIYLDFIYPPQALLLFLDPLINSLPKGWEKHLLVLDCFSESGGRGELIFTDFYDKAPSWIRKVPLSRDVERFHHFFGRIEREFIGNGSRLVINSLTAMEIIWGQEGARSFFGHICPALYAYKTLAYWTINRKAHSQEFLAAIEHTTQVVVELNKLNNQRSICVKKAGGRYESETYKPHKYTVEGLNIRIER